MSSLYTSFAFAVAVLCWAPQDFCLGATIPCSRVDDSSQRIRFVTETSGATSPTNPPDGEFISTKNTIHSMLATYARGTSASSGSNSASTASNITASCPFAWGATNISVPQVAFSGGTSLGASATDGTAGAGFAWGGDGNTRATGTFQVSGTNQTGTLEGMIDIIIGPFNTSGNGRLTSGNWSIQCGGSLLSATLNQDGNGWDVEGGILVDGVFDDLSGPWPLEINTVLFTSQAAQSGDQFLVEIWVDDIEVLADADDDGPTTSSFVGGFSLTSSFEIEQ